MNRILARGLVGQRAVSIADEEECGIVFVRVFVMATAEDRRLKCQLVIKPSAMDGSLQHTCSEMCVKSMINDSVPTEGTPVGLSFSACDDKTHRFQKTSGMAYGKAIKYSPGGLCLQSVSGNIPAKGDVVALGRKCVEGSDAFKRVYTFPNPDCSYGLQTGLLSDSQLYSSSALGESYTASYGRLRNRTSAWCPNGDDADPYFQVDLGYTDEIKGVAIQGQETKYWLVRKFTLSFSVDGTTWFNYTENGLGTKVFSGSSHPLLVKPNTIAPSVTARSVQINPVQWYGKPCLRVELYRCSLRN
ncbi:neuropilin-1-like, partial [Stylophora pistillata]|uniref:neuropilin-1-like n=1 Tax=Stylophora pistillata TaxID=50429 RepID=UPI000C047A76